MVDMQIDNAVEIGPGNVLTGLISRTTDKIVVKKLEV
jgi:malonyl CoA-acyl carrier protein transacylase